MNSLETLRSKIREIDDQIVRLIGARIETGKRIGAVKKQAGIPLRDYDVERSVLERTARDAESVGLAQPFVRSLMRLIISESRNEQERRHYATYNGAAETIAVIGGAGKMGRWFVEFLENQGHLVHAYDARDGAGALADALEDTTFALIATPLEIVPEVIEQLTEQRYGGVVFDIASLKGHLAPAIDAARDAGVSITSVHPMFGPAARTLSDCVICICDCGDAAATERVAGFFKETAATLINLSLTEHDQIVAYVLGLAHLTSLVFTSVLRASGYSFAALDRIGSTTFHAQMETTGTVIQDNPELYFAIQQLNRNTPGLYDSFRRELERITAAVLRDDRDAFVELMSAGNRWLAEHDAR